ncbi:hypothetical protein BDY21DRAFT_353635 [Lineolata rhizophorae]|uniref:Uncharacterized protein n=1 Tax=Lineolata rhizophorae TaxID=578093 RepID=A0A6A6NRF9_9PEZI|nr:hypothetical protein BDY21DRAFT_353635 [Lineolata rhizophorae]
MGPIRRYLRITKYSVLEVHIYLDNPAQTSWLLGSRDPALPRIVEAIRPLVLPKLREENERSRKGKAKRAVKDVVVGGDFEVSIFLNELSSGHSLLTKHKGFEEKKPRIKSNSGKLTGWLTAAGSSSDKPIEVPSDEAGGSDGALILRQEDADEPINLTDIPEAPRSSDDSAEYVGDSDGSDGYQSRPVPRRRGRPGKRRRREGAEAAEDDGADDKKQLALNLSYDGFSIYGRILYLVVKRKARAGATSRGDGATGISAGGIDAGAGAGAGHQMLETWVSTQAAQGVEPEDEDDG